MASDKESKKNEKNSTEGISSSKAKRLNREKERSRARKRARRGKLIAILIPVVIVAVIAFFIGRNVYYNAIKTEASSDFSAMLNDDGTIKDISVSDYVELPGLETIEINESEVAYTTEESDIETLLDGYKTLEKDTTLTVKDKDQVNIDYSGTIDGEAFDGGSTDGNGTDLTIGSGTMVDNFEQQLIGAHAGDQVTVTVTFPDDYATADLAGKTAEFAVTVNGIYSVPELTDEFVKENLSDYAQTAEEYRQYLRDAHYDSAVKTAIQSYIEKNASLRSEPEDYVKYLKGLERFSDEQNYEYMQRMYTSYGLSSTYSSFEDYIGLSVPEYEKQLKTRAEAQAAADFTYQQVYEDTGLEITEEEYNTFLTDNGITEDDYGKGYLMQQIIRTKVIDSLKDKVVLVEAPAEEGATTAVTSK